MDVLHHFRADVADFPERAVQAGRGQAISTTFPDDGAGWSRPIQEMDDVAVFPKMQHDRTDVFGLTMPFFQIIHMLLPKSQFNALPI